MDPTMPSPTSVPTEPNPYSWLTDERRQQLIKDMSSSRPLLQQAGMWRAFLGYWVRWQASLEAKWPKDEEEICLDRLTKKWNEANRDSQKRVGKISDVLLREKLRVSPGVKWWSREQWGHRLDSLYLQSKHQLDKASCRFLRVREKRMASELYFRIKAGETSFAKAAFDFSEGPERNHGGLIPLQPLKSMPFGLAPLLQNLEEGKISQPMRLGKGYCLVELVEFHSSQLDETTEDQLLAEQLRVWIDSVVDVLEADLMWEGETVPNEVT